MQTLYLVDGSSYFYRAYFGLRGLATSKQFDMGGPGSGKNTTAAELRKMLKLP